jgi:hypothetical protein
MDSIIFSYFLTGSTGFFGFLILYFQPPALLAGGRKLMKTKKCPDNPVDPVLFKIL